MDTSFNIRKALISDAERIYQLSTICNELDVHTPYTYWVVLELFPNHCFVLEADGEIVGFITSIISGNTLFLWQMGVLPEFRRHKYGRDLLERAVDSVPPHFDLKITIDPSNNVSHSLFQSFAEKHNYTFECVREINDDLDESFIRNENVYVLKRR